MSPGETKALRHNPDAGLWSVGEGEFCDVRDQAGHPLFLVFWPRGCSCAIHAAISPQRNSDGASWTLSGSEDAPTLTPAVDVKGVWHGLLRDGVAFAVTDGERA